MAFVAAANLLFYCSVPGAFPLAPPADRRAPALCDRPACALQEWLSRLWQVGVALLGFAALALYWITPAFQKSATVPEFELVMEHTHKRTPDQQRQAEH
jgi:hypothetical protein